MKQRCDDILVHKKRFPSLMVFPEGTTNAGNFLMKFKQGAFIHNVPLKLYALEYKNNGFNPCMNLVTELE